MPSDPVMHGASRRKSWRVVGVSAEVALPDLIPESDQHAALAMLARCRAAHAAMVESCWNSK